MIPLMSWSPGALDSGQAGLNDIPEPSAKSVIYYIILYYVVPYLIILYYNIIILYYCIIS